MNVFIEGLETTTLWDTGAQVSMVPKAWWQENLPKVPLRRISELLERTLELSAANGTAIPFDGWIDVNIEMAIGDVGVRTIRVPLLVTSYSLSEPIIGYNVISELVTKPDCFPRSNRPVMDAFSSLSPKMIAEVTALLQTDDTGFLCNDKLGKGSVLVPKENSSR